MSMQSMNSNAGVAACFLPAELVAEIFMFLQNVWPLGRLLSRSMHYVSSWMAVLHVCDIWRRVALATPMLWQDIHAANIHPNLAREFLARSADLGLRISFNPYYSRDKHISTSRDVLLNADVFRRLEALNIVCGEGGALSKLPHELLEHEAPKIRELVIHNQYWTEDFQIPSDMLSSTFPQLHRLSLRACFIPFESLLFAPTLTHLQLSHATLDQDETSSWVERVLFYLSRLPALEYLNLSFHALEPENTISTQKVSLPLLRHLVLSMPPDETDLCTAFLEHLSVSPEVNLVLDASGHALCDQSIYLHLINLVFINGPGGEVQLGVDLSSLVQWHLHHWDPLAKSRVRGKHIDVSPFLTEDVYVPSQLAHLMTSVRPRSLIIGPAFWESLDDTDDDYLIWDGVACARDVRCVTVCYCGCEHLRVMLSDQPTMFPLLETIVLTGAHWKWDDVNDGELAAFEEMNPEVHECPADARVLPDRLFGLLGVVRSMRETRASLKEVKVEGVLAKWWSNRAGAHAALDEMGSTSHAQASGSAASDHTYSVHL